MDTGRSELGPAESMEDSVRKGTPSPEQPEHEEARRLADIRARLRKRARETIRYELEGAAKDGVEPNDDWEELQHGRAILALDAALSDMEAQLDVALVQRNNATHHAADWCRRAERAEAQLAEAREALRQTRSRIAQKEDPFQIMDEIDVALYDTGTLSRDEQEERRWPEVIVSPQGTAHLQGQMPEHEEARRQHCPKCGGEIDWKDGKPFSKAEQEREGYKHDFLAASERVELAEERESAALVRCDELERELRRMRATGDDRECQSDRTAAEEFAYEMGKREGYVEGKEAAERELERLREAGNALLPHLTHTHDYTSAAIECRACEFAAALSADTQREDR